MFEITYAEVIKATIMYGIIRAIWKVLRAGYRVILARANQERLEIIKRHVKDDHSGRLKYCLHDDCASLSSITVLE